MSRSQRIQANETESCYPLAIGIKLRPHELDIYTIFALYTLWQPDLPLVCHPLFNSADLKLPLLNGLSVMF